MQTGLRVLFLDMDHRWRAQMAQAIARARGTAAEVAYACMGTPTALPEAAAAAQESGLLLDESATALSKLREGRFGVVIALSEEAYKACPILPGNPPRVCWRLPPPAAAPAAGLAAARATRDELVRLVADFRERGYADALAQCSHCADLILDTVSDGIIAHDLERRIFFFNAAAERITERRRDEVIGRDCHEVFPGNFCSGKCRFTEDPPTALVEGTRELEVATRSGERRPVVVTMRTLVDSAQQPAGVVLSFRDVTRERRLARRAGEAESFSGIIGRDVKMLEIFELIRSLAESSVPVLIQGESGTGKELIAAAIHNEGPRAGRLFVPVNCGALPEALLESELFGHVKGAFTGAIRDKKGRFELADGGTIFLDEIGDISPAMQVKLLRVLQEGTFERVGSEETIDVNVRVISATNKNIDDEIRSKRFREDLFYRLNVVPLLVPPLRERRNDIPMLVEHILVVAMRDAGRSGVTISPQAMDVLLGYDWPGNIRELQNWIQFALVKCRGDVILPSHWPPARALSPSLSPPSPSARRRKLDEASVRIALQEARGNKVEAARILGVSRATLYRFIDASQADV